MRLNKSSYNYRFPKVTFKKLIVTIIIQGSTALLCIQLAAAKQQPRMERRFQYYVPFTNHTQYRAREHNNTMQKLIQWNLITVTLGPNLAGC